MQLRGRYIADSIRGSGAYAGAPASSCRSRPGRPPAVRTGHASSPPRAAHPVPAAVTATRITAAARPFGKVPRGGEMGQGGGGGGAPPRVGKTWRAAENQPNCPLGATVRDAQMVRAGRIRRPPPHSYVALVAFLIILRARPMHKVNALGARTARPHVVYPSSTPPPGSGAPLPWPRSC
jgi:hypothetical protein